jgi:tellurite resistance protein
MAEQIGPRAGEGKKPGPPLLQSAADMHGPTLRWLRLFAPVSLLLPFAALARIGGGDNYVADSSSSSDGGGEIPIELIWLVIRLTIEYPHVMCPLLAIGGAVYYFVKVKGDPGRSTQKAFQHAEAALKTQVSPAQVAGWVAVLKQKDPSFDLAALYERARGTFVKSQEAWFRRDLSPVRPELSDAMYQRLVSQLDLIKRQGVRPASADMEVLDVTLLGLEQTWGFDTVHLRFSAKARDTEVPASLSDDEARTRARGAALQPFIEVWSFVRRPGAQTRIGQDVSQGKCPNCGAPFKGGHTNNCEFCGAVVNSGNYDWTLSQITQGVEHVSANARPAGLGPLRERDPALSLEALEDRASLIFWKWITAQCHAEPKQLAKLAAPQMLARLSAEVEALGQNKREKHFLRCAVGGVRVLEFRTGADGADEAHVELRWSAQLEIVNAGQKPPRRPPVHQRWVFVLARDVGATSNPKNGMATSRCPGCNAPLTDTLTSSCDFCGAELSHGAADWVLRDARTYEAWRALGYAARAGARSAPAGVDAAGARLLDLSERKRLLSVMAAMAAADGHVDEKERKLLKMCAQRWSIPWAEVEEWLRRGPQAFGELVQPGSAEAESFLRALVDMALVDGKVDRKERELLQAAAHHLGVVDKLAGMLGGK